MSDDGHQELNRSLWRVFTYTEGKSDKFWKIRAAGRWLETWWGRSGTQGQKKAREYSNPFACLHAEINLVDQKLRKGYLEQPSEEPGTPIPAHSRPAPIRRPHVDPLTGRVAVYALRNVLGAGSRVVHERGFKQMLRSADAAEVVTGSHDYGYWHPDEVPAEDQTSRFIQAATENLSGLTGAARAVGIEAARTAAALSQLSAAYTVAAPLVRAVEEETEREHQRRQAEQLAQWGVSYCGYVHTGTERQVLGAVHGVCTNSTQATLVQEKLRQLIRQGGGRDEVMSLAGNSLGEIVVSRVNAPAAAALRSAQAPRGMVEMTAAQVEAEISRQTPVDTGRARNSWNVSVGPRETTPGQIVRLQRPEWEPLGLSDKRLEAVAWHYLIRNGAGNDFVCWRIRYLGRLLETAEGGSSGTRDRHARQYNREEDVLPEVHSMVLDKLRRGYYPQGPEQDELILEVAKTDPAVWAVVRVIMAEALRPRGTVALGRFTTIDDEEEI